MQYSNNDSKDRLMSYANLLFKSCISSNKLELVPIIEKAKEYLSTNTVAHSEILKMLNHVNYKLINNS